MWDTVQEHRGADALQLTHDLPCQQCGHAPHTYLACSDTCGCRPTRVERVA